LSNFTGREGETGRLTLSENAACFRKPAASVWPGQALVSRSASPPLFLNRNIRNPQLFHSLIRTKVLSRNEKEGNADAQRHPRRFESENAEKVEPMKWQENTKF
jgi:hypothetical protein